MAAWQIGGKAERFRWMFGLLVVVARMPGSADAGDWPQILGPERNGKATKEKLANAWPTEGPEIVWKQQVGSGYAGVAVADGLVVLWHRQGDESVAEGMRGVTGEKVWRASYPTTYKSLIAPDDGPRCVPLIHRDRVYLVGAQGDLHCVTLKEGRKVWDVDAFQKFAAPEGYFGAGSTPIVEGDRLIMNVGGRGAGIGAFSLVDGSTVWKGTEEEASYSAPTKYVDAGKSRVVFATRYQTIAIDPQTGKVFWRYPFGMRGPSVNAATPIVIDGHLFLSASYGVGARWLRLSKDKVDEVWESNDVMSSQYATCVEHQGVLYGIDGRQDQGTARLRAFDPRSQKIYWTEENFGTGNLILVDGKLLILKTDGELVMALATPEGYKPLATAKVLETTAQALPALADGVLYVRDTQSLKALRLP